MNKNVKIDPICENDFEALVSLFKEFAVFEKLPDKMINSVERMKKEKDFIHGFTVKNDEGEIFGYVTFFYAYYTWTGKSLYMDDLYVCPKYRGQGLGTLLIKRVIAQAAENNCHKLRWQVSDWNTSAIKFYETLGATIDHIEMNCDLLIK